MELLWGAGEPVLDDFDLAGGHEGGDVAAAFEDGEVEFRAFFAHFVNDLIGQ